MTDWKHHLSLPPPIQVAPLPLSKQPLLPNKKGLTVASFGRDTPLPGWIGPPTGPPAWSAPVPDAGAPSPWTAQTTQQKNNPFVNKEKPQENIQSKSQAFKSMRVSYQSFYFSIF